MTNSTYRPMTEQEFVAEMRKLQEEQMGYLKRIAELIDLDLDGDDAEDGER